MFVYRRLSFLWDGYASLAIDPAQAGCHFRATVYCYNLLMDASKKTIQNLTATNAHLHAVASTLMSVNDIEIEKAVRMLEQVRRQDAFVWLVGNGGSAATCSHFANDLEKMCKIRAISVPDMTPTLLAYGNDEGWDNMFWRVVGEYGRSNDVLVAISCSGKSQNVVKAAGHWAYSHLVVLTGDSVDSALVMPGAHAVIGVPHSDIKVQEDVHLAVCHAIVGALKK